MDFRLTEEQRAFQESVRRFAADHLAKGAVARAHDEGFPWDVARLMAENGLFGIMLPEADGGQGGALMDAVLAAEAIAEVCPRSGDVLQAGNFGAFRTFAEYATAEQKERWFAPLLAGKAICAVGMTEPEAGSALTDLRSTCTADGNGWRLNGGKVFTSNSDDASVFLIYCRFGPGTEGIGSVILERGMEGFSFGEKRRYLNGETWRPLHFDNVFIPPSHVLLKQGGFRRQIAGFNVERVGNSARSRAVGECAFRLAKEHAETRVQFGRKLAEFQGLQWKFAEMRVALDGAQLLLYRAAANAGAGLPDAQEVAIAKYACNQAGWLAVNEAMQVMGGTGYSDDVLLEYCLRKSRGWMIAGGSLEMMRNRIAEGVFGRSFPQRPPRAS
jgi:hypothetical protein